MFKEKERWVTTDKAVLCGMKGSGWSCHGQSLRPGKVCDSSDLLMILSLGVLCFNSFIPWLQCTTEAQQQLS